jgi:hypothetical protein
MLLPTQALAQTLHGRPLKLPDGGAVFLDQSFEGFERKDVNLGCAHGHQRGGPRATNEKSDFACNLPNPDAGDFGASHTHRQLSSANEHRRPIPGTLGNQYLAVGQNSTR